MNPACDRAFDEALLSGYLDGALIQLDEQRVRVHLERCPACRAELAALSELRDAARSTRFVVPDLQWDERPRSGPSRLLRSAGWVMGVAFVVGGAGAGAIALAHAGGVAAALGFGGAGAFGLLFLSVLIDRLRVARTDPYRELQK